jgi:hypothetical protein
MPDQVFNQRISDCINEALSSLGPSFARVLYLNWKLERGFSEKDVATHPKEFSSFMTKMFGAIGASSIEAVILKKIRADFQLEEKTQQDLAVVLESARRKFESSPRVLCSACESGNHKNCESLWEIVLRSPDREVDLKPGEKVVQCCDRKLQWIIVES